MDKALVQRALDDFVAAANKVYGADLRSIVLYGTAAEDRLRPASDVNVVLVLSAFDPEKASAIRGPLSLARAAIRLRAMFILEAEIPAALDAFAQKFADILRRRKVLHGDDPFASARVSREALIRRLGQVLLNVILRFREAYVTRGAYPEQLGATIAEQASTLRSCAASLIDLESGRMLPGKEALQAVAGANGPWTEALACISEARERRLLPGAAAETTILRMIEIAQHMASRAEALR